MKRILVADDDAANRLLVREVLSPLNHEIVEAGDGREALEKIREDLPDLVLLDIQMPKLDGFAVLKEIRKDSRLAAIRVIALTALAMPGDRGKTLEAGFDGHMPKPISPLALREEVKKLLG